MLNLKEVFLEFFENIFDFDIVWMMCCYFCRQRDTSLVLAKQIWKAVQDRCYLINKLSFLSEFHVIKIIDKVLIESCYLCLRLFSFQVYEIYLPKTDLLHFKFDQGSWIFNHSYNLLMAAFTIHFLKCVMGRFLSQNLAFGIFIVWVNKIEFTNVR